jgi:hypothetical protein
VDDAPLTERAAGRRDIHGRRESSCHDVRRIANYGCDLKHAMLVN